MIKCFNILDFRTFLNNRKVVINIKKDLINILKRNPSNLQPINNTVNGKTSEIFALTPRTRMPIITII